MFVLILSTTIFSEVFLILERTEPCAIKKCIVLHVKYNLFCSKFNEILISWTDFGEILKYQISRKSVQWEPGTSMRTDG
jgi:hypothetical protein